MSNMKHSLKVEAESSPKLRIPDDEYKTTIGGVRISSNGHVMAAYLNAIFNGQPIGLKVFTSMQGGDAVDIALETQGAINLFNVLNSAHLANATILVGIRNDKIDYAYTGNVQ